ncbi:type IV secretory system conjugative DNA transfer family protein [Candidatus Saccharibacteria bacterium]|nr:type IV secretory system conjugative DNA transfer family protein [Candidatus Saccharibacteria bacterium]
MAGLLVTIFVFASIGAAIAAGIYFLYRQSLREAKNYERGLKMIPLRIHLPPSSEDIEAGGRDERDVTQEAISQAQVMYNIIASTATKGFKSKLFGQRHIAFEVTVKNGMVNYYVVVPVVLIDVIRQAVSAAYPAATLEEVEEQNIFSQTGRISGTIGGELTLKNDYSYPIATFEEAKRDAMVALLNALSGAGKDDGAAIQILLRPAQEGWSKSSNKTAQKIRQGKSGKGGSNPIGTGILEMLWKPPAAGEKKEGGGDHQVSSLEQSYIEAIEEKTRYPAYETLIRVIASSNTAAQSQTLVKNVVAAFALFDAPNKNGFKFSVTNNIEQFTTAFIFRFFPQNIKNNILNSIELATIFHLPDQSSIPTSQVERQAAKQVDGPNFVPDKGLLLGVNVFRGVKKEIRLSENDRRRHTYVIGQTGTGKSVLLENLALQDMLEGRGFAFIDPHGDTAETLLGMVPKHRVEDVIYFNPGDMTNPVGLNMFEFDNPDQKDFLIQEAINMLYGLYDPGHTGIIGPRLEHIFRYCALLLMSDPNGGTFIDIPKILVDNDFMKSKLKYVKDQDVLDFWTKEYPNSQRSNESGEVTSWVVSKFGPFMSNTMMRNVMGQTKSGFNLRDIMDNRKILIVNLSQGKMGELNSRLLGMIFIMKFQTAVMSRDDILEEDREDFCLYVDEFQNFATDSFESILSQVRKYRLNLIIGNQFMTQLNDKVREAIIGNVGTVISGRIGVTDAELLVKRFQPTFDMEDLIKLPNYQAIANVMINNVPSAPFSMNFLPPLGGAQPNNQLSDALKKLSAAKHGRPRAEVEREIFTRLGASTKQLDQTTKQIRGASEEPSSGSSFLDEWLAKRKEISAKKVETNQKPPVKKSKEETITPTVPTPADPTQQDISTVEHSGDLSVQGSGESDEEVHVAIR